MGNNFAMDKMFIIVPCYNEEAVLTQSCGCLLEELNLLIKNNKISEESKIIFVDDGSKDKTWKLISHFSDDQWKRDGRNEKKASNGMLV